MDKIIAVHDYVDLASSWKVLSFGSILRVAEDLNNQRTSKFRDSSSFQ